MKKKNLKEWFRQWDAGEFDFIDAGAAEEPSPRTTSPEEGMVAERWEMTPMESLRRRELESYRKVYPVMAAIMAVIIIVFLFLTVAELPAFGSADAPAHNEVMERYVELGMEETGAVNTVAGVILDYRAFDTLGESHVLYAAMVAVLILLLSVGGEEKESELSSHVMQDDIILRTTAKVLVPIIILFGIYVIFNGHLGPGGGFSGGAIIGSGLILYCTAFGFEGLERYLNLKSFRIVVLCALCFYSVAKCYSFYCGANHIESFITTGIPGRIFSAGLILPLNIAVGVVVACTMYGLYSVFKRGRI